MNRRCAVKGNVKIIDFMPKGTVTLRFCHDTHTGQKPIKRATAFPKRENLTQGAIQRKFDFTHGSALFLILLSAAFNCCTSAGVMDFATCFRMERKDVRAI